MTGTGSDGRNDLSANLNDGFVIHVLIVHHSGDQGNDYFQFLMYIPSPITHTYLKHD